MMEAIYAVVGHIKRLAAGGPVDPSGVFLLDMLRRCGAARPAELAARTGLDQSTISRKLRSLDQQGYLQRLPDPSDGRASLVNVTDHGAQLLRASLDARSAALDAALAGWSDADRECFGRLLHRLAEDVGALDGHAGCPAHAASANSTGTTESPDPAHTQESA